MPGIPAKHRSVTVEPERSSHAIYITRVAVKSLSMFIRKLELQHLEALCFPQMIAPNLATFKRDYLVAYERHEKVGGFPTKF